MAYNGSTICLNGHVISSYKANFQKYCTVCGKETYSRCTSCGSPIRGLLKLDGLVITGPYIKPYYCYKCGSAYPWTQKILNNAVELLSLDNDLNDVSKEIIKNAIPELLVDAPTTPLAVAKYKKEIAHAGQIIKDSMRQLLIDVVSETVKKSLFQ